MQPNQDDIATLTGGDTGLSRKTLGSVVPVLGAVILALTILGISKPSASQEAGWEVWGQAGCGSCHGDLAEGGDDPAAPTGPNLRTSRLDRDLLAETIACGRPGTPMPFFLTGSYTESSCYGLPPGEVPAEVKGAGGFTAEELESLVNFLTDNVVGQRKITRDNCAVFYGGNRNSPLCLQYN